MLASYQVLCISCELSPQDISQQEQVLVVYICISYPSPLWQVILQEVIPASYFSYGVIDIVSIWVGKLGCYRLSYRYGLGGYRYRIDTGLAFIEMLSIRKKSFDTQP